MTGKDAVRRILEEENVRYIFGNPGSTEIPLLDALANKPDLDYVLTLHESVAVAMADGYARASGKPGVVSVHACPGTTNSLGNLYNAWVDDVPLVVLAGQQDSRMLIKEPPLSGNLVRLAEQFTKWSYEVSRIEELPIALRRAFKEATSPPTGPVFLSLPKNILDDAADFDVVPASKYHITARVHGDPRDIDRAAALLASAERPGFIAGPGVARSGGTPELVELAELLAARVYASPGVFPSGHALCFGTFERKQLASAIQASDVLLVTGTEMFPEFEYSPTPLLPNSVRAIHLDVNPWEIAKNIPVEVGILADPKAGLAQLVEKVKLILDSKGRAAIEQRHAHIKEEQVRRKALIAKEKLNWSRLPLSIGLVLEELRELLNEDAIVVDQSIHSSTYLKRYFDFDKPGTYYGERGGTLGWALGAALGVKLAQPHRQVVALAGDGSTMFAPQALWTAAQRNIGAMMLVINNGGYMAVKALSLAYGAEWAKRGEFIGAHIIGIDYRKLAESLGVPARQIQAPEDIRPTLRWGLELNKPALIEVVVDPKDAGFGWPRLP